MAPSKDRDTNNADQQAMARLAAGDHSALNQLMTHWTPRLIAFLTRLTGNTATAEDLAQETFVRLYQSRDRYQPIGQFSTYLFQIAANLARNQARWKSRHPESPVDESQGQEFTDPGNDPSSHTMANETVQAVHRAVAALPEDLRLPLVLAVYENQSRNAIATILGCSPKAAEMRIYRARLALREALAPHLLPD